MSVFNLVVNFLPSKVNVALPAFLAFLNAALNLLRVSDTPDFVFIGDFNFIFVIAKAGLFVGFAFKSLTTFFNSFDNINNFNYTLDDH